MEQSDITHLLPKILKFNPEKTSDKSKFHSIVGLYCSKMVVSWKSEELEIGNTRSWIGEVGMISTKDIFRTTGNIQIRSDIR